MKIPFVPDYYFPDIYAIDPERLRARGVKVLLADLDNTLAPYRRAQAQRGSGRLAGAAGAGGHHPLPALEQPPAGAGAALRRDPGHPL